MKTPDLLKRLASALLVPVVLCAAAGLGWLDTVDYIFSDALYQRLSRTATDGEIVVIGIDDRALEAFGAWPWPRDILADALRRLNENPENRPAVIGVDVLFVGEGSDPSADAYLAETAAECGNVVVASSATFGSQLVLEESAFYMDDRAIIGWDAPYPALAAASSTGHINTMADRDGVIRRGILRLDVPGAYMGTEAPVRVMSFARIIYERWCAERGQAPNPPPDTSDCFFYLPFAAHPDGSGHCFDEASVADLLEGALSPDYFAGKIVLIGPYASGMMDSYPTAADRSANMYGVEIQANMIEAFRRGFFPRTAERRTQILLLFAACSFVQAFFYDRRVRAAVPVWLVGSAGWVALCAALYERAGLVLRVFWTPALITVLFVVSVTANYVRAQRERRRVTETFGRYVDPAVLKELLETGGASELGGVTREIAVLFVDIRGFTTMSEALDPPTVVEIINQYLTLTTECIMRRHGTLDKFVGDCTMAFWNAPLPQKDPAYLACQAAMDMAEGSKALGEQLQKRFGRTVSFGIGVNYGPAVVGNIGAPKRMDYTAIGDTVNTAARLEANAPGGSVFISRSVADALGDRATVTSLGDSIKLKGKAEGFEILTLDALK
ncbi:MAG: adenylate/guanylate cyclase domain-containing protein [Oscillibacter sp.]|nr:adenylate/guanylate cyclase domain-containing protein [Oscillibacter sp.]